MFFCKQQGEKVLRRQRHTASSKADSSREIGLILEPGFSSREIRMYLGKLGLWWPESFMEHGNMDEEKSDYVCMGICGPCSCKHEMLFGG